MVELKMVAGQTYVCPPVFGPERVVVRGEVVEVSEEHAEILLADTFSDGLNNTHAYFKEVESSTKASVKVRQQVEDDSEEEQEDDGEVIAEKAPAGKRSRAAK